MYAHIRIVMLFHERTPDFQNRLERFKRFRIPFIKLQLFFHTAGLGIGLIGMKAAESTGRNPGASGQVLTISIILAALVEGVAFVAIFMG